MNVLLEQELRFEAAHKLPNVPRDHKCARLHGHSFRVVLAVAGPVQPDVDWLIDYADIHKAWRPLYDQLDHRYLNDVEGLANPTSENLARWIWQRLRPELPQLCRVTVSETCDSRCVYEGD